MKQHLRTLLLLVAAVACGPAAWAQNATPKSPPPAKVPAWPSMAAPVSPAPPMASSPSGGLVDPARGPSAILETTRPPRLSNQVNDDQRLPRNYERQPPIIPHRVDGYQVDRNFNKCLDCHARERTEMTQAVPVSATHYVDRSGKVLDHVSTRRYFCLQCHVPQEAAQPIVGNGFRGVAAGAAVAPTPSPSTSR